MKHYCHRHGSILERHLIKEYDPKKGIQKMKFLKAHVLNLLFMNIADAIH